MNNCNHPRVSTSSVPNVYECIDCNSLSAGLPSGSSVIAAATTQTNNSTPQFVYNPVCCNNSNLTHSLNYITKTGTYACTYISCNYDITSTEATSMSRSDEQLLLAALKYKDWVRIPTNPLTPSQATPQPQGVNPTHTPLTTAHLQIVLDAFRVKYGKEPTEFIVPDQFRHYLNSYYPPPMGVMVFCNIFVQCIPLPTSCYSIFAQNASNPKEYVELDLSIPVVTRTTTQVFPGIPNGTVTPPPNMLPYVPTIQGFNPPSYWGRAEYPKVYPSACAHTWQHYAGLTEVYDFCTKCDEKKR